MSVTEMSPPRRAWPPHRYRVTATHRTTAIRRKRIGFRRTPSWPYGQRMEALTVTPNLTMLRIRGWQIYVWRDGESATLIDTGAPGSGAEIAAVLSGVSGIDRIMLTHGHVDHCGSAAELRESTGASVLAGAGDAAVIRSEAEMPPPVLEDWGKAYPGTGFSRSARRRAAGTVRPRAARRRRARLRWRRARPRDGVLRSRRTSCLRCR